MRTVYFSIIWLSRLLSTFSILNGEGNVCGRPNGSGFKLTEGKIVGGYDVGYYRYPWFVAFMDSNIVACGGTLVGTKAVISAAHCYREYIESSNNRTKLEQVYRIVLGMFNSCEKEKTQKVVQVQKVYIHEKYKNNVPYYDISLIILKESAHAYEPLCLPPALIKTRPKEGTVPGFGTLRYHGPTPCTQQEARLLIYSDEECKNMINRTGNDPTKFLGAFCGGYLQGGIDTCQGDSGGPFQIADEYGNYILLGVVSFGFHCANPDLLGVYTDVSHYIDWIEAKAGFNATINTLKNTTARPEVTTTLSTSSGKPVNNPYVINVLRPSFNPVNIIILKNNKQTTHNTTNWRKLTKHKPKSKNKIYN